MLRPMKKGAWGSLVLFCWGLAGMAHAASFDPHLHWRTLSTPHFSVHYADNIEKIAQKVARDLEIAHDKLTPKLKWTPKSKTEVLLLDNTDDANGFASILPYNWLELRVAPPNPEEALAHYDDWLQMLVTHEYTHILHLDEYGGFWSVLHLLFGKVAAPNGLTPIWIKEGLATFEETERTDGGRGRSSYAEMLVRTAVLKNQFPTIDRADGSQWKWPGGQIPYLFGVKFLEYLSHTYGEEKLAEFNRRTSRSLLIGAVNHQAKKVFGKSFYQLWRDWQKQLQKEYRARFEGMTETPMTLLENLNKKGNVLSLPTWAPAGETLYFQVADPKKMSAVWRLDSKSGKIEKVMNGAVSQMALSPDGTKLIFSRMGAFNRYYQYYDLWFTDLKTKKTKRLTQGLRARDPDFFPDGERVLFVARETGKDTLKILNLKDNKITPVLSDVKDFTQFHNPRVAPNGKGFVVTAFHFQKGWDLFWLSGNGNQIRQLTHSGRAIETRPVWSPDGKFIYYSADNDGLSNIVRMEFATGKVSQVTNVLTGAFQPAVSPDGKELVVRYYNGKGFDLRRFVIARSVTTKQSRAGVTDAGLLRPKGPRNDKISAEFSSQPYSPFRKTLLPHYLMPGYLFLNNSMLLTLMTGGSDPLEWHAWDVGGSYRTHANVFGGFADYVYKRWRTSMGFSFADAVVDYGNLYGLGNYFEERRGGSVFASYPWSRNRLTLGYSMEQRIEKGLVPAKAPIVPNGGRFGGVTLTYGFGSGFSFPASISVEKGRRITLSGTSYDKILGTQEGNEKQVLYGDWREYIELGKRNVLALRLAGGYAWGDSVFPRVFTLGGSLGEGGMAGPPSTRYFPLRGLLTPTFSGDRAMLMSAEYRLPLFSPQRGLGTWPIFLNNCHIGFFADSGDIWSAGSPRKGGSIQNFFDDFLVGVGTELRADFIVGHGLPLTGRLGYGMIVVNRSRLGNLTDPLLGSSLKNGTLIMQWGTSF